MRKDPNLNLGIRWSRIMFSIFILFRLIKQKTAFRAVNRQEKRLLNRPFELVFVIYHTDGSHTILRAKRCQIFNF